MKVIVKDRVQKKIVMNENIDYDEELAKTRIGGRYDFIMMMSDGTIYGAQLDYISWHPIENISDPIGFQWERRVIDDDGKIHWLPIDIEYDDEVGYDDDEEDWVPFEDMDIYDDEGEYDDGGYEYE